MEIDHVFMFVDRDGPELAQLMHLGLTVTYQREHPGQGTANACFCFANMFLELLWMDDPKAALTTPIVRSGLEPRSRWREAGTCPFGLAWRGDAAGAIPTWPFAPPYLPNGVAIDVATDGDDPRQPMMFTFPGSTAPSTWEIARRGGLQQAAGLDIIAGVYITIADDVEPSPALLHLEKHCVPDLKLRRGAGYELEIILKGETRHEQVCFR
jgi:hypothetical protein